MPDSPAPGTTPGLRIARVFDAPRERLWREWTRPEAFADWFGGPQGEIPLASVSMDVREGGAWKATMHFGGREIHWHGRYVEVAEPERLVLTVSDQPGDDPDEIVTVELTDVGDGRTEMILTQGGGGLTAEEYERAKHGWGGFLDRMSERLADGA